ncbi:hypothetical protein BC833DRAFT_216003 [Globomyces pollinis-pini]|nr:hypothetical protein BC833DRAFT_216003 [Globomyces pollinis-pini]
MMVIELYLFLSVLITLLKRAFFSLEMNNNEENNPTVEEDEDSDDDEMDTFPTGKIQPSASYARRATLFAPSRRSAVEADRGPMSARVPSNGDSNPFPFGPAAIQAAQSQQSRLQPSNSMMNTASSTRASQTVVSRVSMHSVSTSEQDSESSSVVESNMEGNKEPIGPLSKSPSKRGLRTSPSRLTIPNQMNTLKESQVSSTASGSEIEVPEISLPPEKPEVRLSVTNEIPKIISSDTGIKADQPKQEKVAPPKSPVERHIPQPLHADKQSVNASSNGGDFTGRLERLFAKWYYSGVDAYNRNVTIHYESLLICIFLLILVIVRLIIYSLEPIRVNSVHLAFGFKIFLFFLDLASIGIIFVLSYRLQTLGLIYRVLNGSMTLKKLSETTETISLNIITKINVVAFFCLSQVLLFLIYNEPTIAPIGYGTTKRLPNVLSSIPNSTFSDIISMANGAINYCVSCNGLYESGYQFLPISSHLVKANPLQVVRFKVDQDIIVISTSCQDVQPSITELPKNTIWSNIKSFEMLEYGTKSTIQISSYNADGSAIKSKECDVTTSDKRGTTLSRFHTNRFGKTTPMDMEIVKRSNSGCTTYGAYCLSNSRRLSVSYKLLEPILTSKTISHTISNIAPDSFPPSLSFDYSNDKFEEKLGYTYATLLRTAMPYEEYISTDCSVDSTYCQVYLSDGGELVRFPLVLKWVVFGWLVWCSLFSVVELIYYTYRLWHITSPLLNRLRLNVRIGRTQLEDLTSYVCRLKQMKSKQKWDKIKIRFGEDMFERHRITLED